MTSTPRDRMRTPHAQRRVSWYDSLIGLCTKTWQGHDEPDTSARFRLLELPVDAMDVVVRFLTGFDLLALSHVNRQYYNELLASDGAVWQRLAPWHAQDDTLRKCTPPPLQRQRSMWLTMSTNHRDVPSPTAKERSFSFDLWFALLPVIDASCARVGGVLLGAQSVSAIQAAPARYHQPLVHADSHGNLYCSVLRETPVVAEKLALKRWYHVALVFDAAPTSGNTPMQHVYLDGKLVHTAHGPLHDEWQYLYRAQLGTGCLASPGSSTGDWHAFYGLIHECRFWEGALNSDTIGCLATGTSIDATASVSKLWSMRETATRSSSGWVSLAQCTAPSEGMVANVTITDTLSSGSIPLEGYNIVRCF